MIELIASLEHNTTLLSLNLANNKLEGPIGSAMKAMLDKNHTLIDLEVGFNSFSLADVSLLNIKFVDKSNLKVSYKKQSFV